MSVNALYTDLSGYYDLMCADIDYQAQSHCIQRLQQLFGNGGVRHASGVSKLHAGDSTQRLRRSSSSPRRLTRK